LACANGLGDGVAVGRRGRSGHAVARAQPPGGNRADAAPLPRARRRPARLGVTRRPARGAVPGARAWPVAPGLPHDADGLPRRRRTYSPDWGARVQEQWNDDMRPTLGAAAELLDPMPLIGALEMTSVERGSRNGRDVFRATATPRFPLPASLGVADREELVVDA